MEKEEAGRAVRSSSRRIEKGRKRKRRRFNEIVDMRPGDNEWGSLFLTIKEATCKN